MLFKLILVLISISVSFIGTTIFVDSDFFSKYLSFIINKFQSVSKQIQTHNPRKTSSVSKFLESRKFLITWIHIKVCLRSMKWSTDRVPFYKMLMCMYKWFKPFFARKSLTKTACNSRFASRRKESNTFTHRICISILCMLLIFIPAYLSNFFRVDFFLFCFFLKKAQQSKSFATTQHTRFWHS